MESKPKIFAASGSLPLAEKIAQAYGTKLGKVELSRFSDGEFQPCFEETVRGAHVYLVCSTPPPSDNLMELLLMIDCAKRASASKIIAVLPYFGWARQDRKDKPRVPIGAKMVAKMLEAAGATRIVTMDLHADQIQGFFEMPVDHLYASSIFVDYIKDLQRKGEIKDLAVASPDMGGSKRAYSYAKYFGSDVVICYKQRKKANVIESMTLIGDVEGKDIILLDDMVDTAGTLTKAADIMMDRGACSVRTMVTHPILSGQAYERIEKSGLKELITTDSIALKNSSDKIKVLSCAPLMADAIKLIEDNASISAKYIL